MENEVQEQRVEFHGVNLRGNRRDDWQDWRWQQKNTIRDLDSLYEMFPYLSATLKKNIQDNLTGRRLQITPHYFQLMMNSLHGDNIEKNPLWRQVVPFWSTEITGGYDGITENWELEHEMKTPICQHKYDNRVILRLTNVCNAYCQYCFEALRTLNTDSPKASLKRDSFKESVEYIRSNSAIEEVILSGGEPLMLGDEKLEEYLAELRGISDDLLIRVHTRTLTFNPYRITDKLLAIFKKYRVNAIGLHMCHPSEIGQDYQDAVRRIQSVVPIVFSNMPLLGGVNDKYEILYSLFIKLYRLGIKPYYLYHFMPFSPGASEYQSSIKSAIRTMKRLRRHISNIAMPEYVLPHARGKFTVPLIEDDADIPYFEENVRGEKWYRFVNWQGDQCEWRDT